MQENMDRRDKRIDKIMRKNLEHPSAELLSFFITGKIIKTLPLPPRTNQLIFEQEPDTLLLIEIMDRNPFIFHLEFQSYNDHRMVDRMASYDYMLRLKHNMDVVSAVIYTGNEKMRMKNSLKSDNNYYEYQLIDIRDIDPGVFLHSVKPAEVMLAILTGRNDKSKSLLIRQILSKLRKMLSRSPSILNEQVSIFKILGAIRGNNIDQQIEQEEQNMPISLDVSKTLFYQRALKEGIEKGVEKGIEKIVSNMLEANVPVVTIQTYTGLSKKELQKIMKEHKSGKKGL